MTQAAEILETLRGASAPLSSAYLADWLGIRRDAVMHAVENLRQCGHVISHKRGEGYTLVYEVPSDRSDAHLAALARARVWFGEVRA